MSFSLAAYEFLQENAEMLLNNKVYYISRGRILSIYLEILDQVFEFIMLFEYGSQLRESNSDNIFSFSRTCEQGREKEKRTPGRLQIAIGVRLLWTAAVYAVPSKIQIPYRYISRKAKLPFRFCK